MLICAHHLAFYYGEEKILEEIDIDLEQGDYLVIAGPNGSGKSTLIKGLVGLKKPQSGVVHYNFKDKKQGLGYMPQQHDFQRDFPASVEEIARTGIQRKKGFSPFYSRAEKKEVLRTLTLLGIGNLARKSFSSLSGGQQQRVLLARALLASSELLILDEPTAGLDPLVTREFYHLLATLNKKGTALIMVSHDLKLALEDANKVLYLEGGGGKLYQKNDFLASDTGQKVVQK
ncbi:MAG TPA: ABC transporter ATP-binding protein [Clostridia bacterium]|nr:ABC transporter ATP-binding protein [Clostridia bacterium]